VRKRFLGRLLIGHPCASSRRTGGNGRGGMRSTKNLGCRTVGVTVIRADADRSAAGKYEGGVQLNRYERCSKRHWACRLQKKGGVGSLTKRFLTHCKASKDRDIWESQPFRKREVRKNKPATEYWSSAGWGHSRITSSLDVSRKEVGTRRETWGGA